MISKRKSGTELPSRN